MLHIHRIRVSGKWRSPWPLTLACPYCNLPLKVNPAPPQPRIYVLLEAGVFGFVLLALAVIGLYFGMDVMLLISVAVGVGLYWHHYWRLKDWVQYSINHSSDNREVENSSSRWW